MKNKQLLIIGFTRPQTIKEHDNHTDRNAPVKMPLVPTSMGILTWQPQWEKMCP